MSNPIKTKRKKAIRALLPAYCAKCGSTENLTIDHIVPRVRGGTNELANLQTLCSPCNQQKSRKEQRYRRPAKSKLTSSKPASAMITKLALVTEPNGFTVQLSTTHRTHAGALAHLNELLAHSAQEQRQRKAAAVAALAADDTLSKPTTALPHQNARPGATSAEADEQATPPAPALFNFASPGRRSPSGEEPPF